MTKADDLDRIDALTGTGAPTISFILSSAVASLFFMAALADESALDLAEFDGTSVPAREAEITPPARACSSRTRR